MQHYKDGTKCAERERERNPCQTKAVVVTTDAYSRAVALSCGYQVVFTCPVLAQRYRDALALQQSQMSRLYRLSPGAVDH